MALGALTVPAIAPPATSLSPVNLAPPSRGGPGIMKMNPMQSTIAIFEDIRTGIERIPEALFNVQEQISTSMKKVTRGLGMIVNELIKGFGGNVRDKAIDSADADSGAPPPAGDTDSQGNEFQMPEVGPKTGLAILLLGLAALMKFSDKLVKPLAAVLEGTKKIFTNTKEFIDATKEDAIGAITGPGTVIAGLKAFRIDLIKTIKSSKLFALIGSGFGLLDTAGGPAGAGSKVGLLSRIANIFKPLTTLGSTIAKLPVISQIVSVFGKGGTLLKSLGKLFLPFTIIIGLFDTIKGFYNGFFGKDLEEGEEIPDTFLEKFVEGIKGGITGLVNSLIGAPLDLLTNGIAFIIGKMGFDETSEALKNFSFKDLFTKLIAVPFDFITSVINWIPTVFTDPVKAMQDLWNGIVGEGGLLDIIYAPIDKAIGFIMGIFGFDAPDTALTDEEGNFIGLKDLAIKAVKGVYEYVKSFFQFDFPSVGDVLKGAGDVMASLLRAVLPSPDFLTFETPSVTLFGKKFGGGTISLNPIPDSIYKAANIDPETGADLVAQTEGNTTLVTGSSVDVQPVTPTNGATLSEGSTETASGGTVVTTINTTDASNTNNTSNNTTNTGELSVDGTDSTAKYLTAAYG